MAALTRKVPASMATAGPGPVVATRTFRQRRAGDRTYRPRQGLQGVALRQNLPREQLGEQPGHGRGEEGGTATPERFEHYQLPQVPVTGDEQSGDCRLHSAADDVGHQHHPPARPPVSYRPSEQQ